MFKKKNKILFFDKILHRISAQNRICSAEKFSNCRSYCCKRASFEVGVMDIRVM